MSSDRWLDGSITESPHLVRRGENRETLPGWCGFYEGVGVIQVDSKEQTPWVDGLDAETYAIAKQLGGALYAPQNIRDEADDLEFWLWRAAEAMGIPRTQESVDRFDEKLKRIVSGNIDVAGRDREAALAMGFMAVSLVRDDGCEGDRYWSLLSFCKLMAGIVYGEYSPSGEAFNLLFEQGNSELLKASKAKRGRDDVRKKLSNDPQQRAKKYVKEKWGIWIKGRSIYGGRKIDFARAMLKDPMCSTLTNQAVIVRWCTQWEKANAKS